MATEKKMAGGRATEAGMAFQARVGIWFAAYLVADLPVGQRFGLDIHSRPTRLRFETGVGLDDVVVSLTNGGTIFVQCKTDVGLSSKADSALGKTLAQLVAIFLNARAQGSGNALARSTAVLATATTASGSLRDLEEACRAFDRGGQWEEVKLEVSERQKKALEIFETQVRDAWIRQSGAEPNEQNLISLARLFHVTRFAVDPSGHDWREAAQIVGLRLFGDPAIGEAPTQALLETVRQLIRNGATADRPGLLRAVRSAGYEDTRSPGYDEDIARLGEMSRDEYRRLRRHSFLPIRGGLPVHRDCLAPLSEAIQEGSLLVVGEPGAGKTGVLVAVVEERLQQVRAPIVFISVDRRAGVTTADDLRLELRLEHPLLDVLSCWPGRQPGLLVIDALDASRGEASETVFANLIEDAVGRLGERWSVVASIRTFDLKNGRRFREVLKGAPPHPGQYSEAGFNEVRHFKIPRLSDAEVAKVAQASSELGSLTSSAPASLKELLRNVFNLSLAAELIAIGVPAESIRTITTQSDLIDRYEDKRLASGRLKEAVAVAVETMVKRRRLSIKRVAARHEALDDVLATGVMTEAGDLITFAHHVLFDHIAGRFFLEWNDPQLLAQQITSEPGIGLMLAPSLRFAMERVWREDKSGRQASWRLIAAIAAVAGADPVISSVALRFGADRVADIRDVGALTGLISSSPDTATTGSMLSRLARFVRMSIAESGAVAISVATAWASVAFSAAEKRDRHFADAARFFLWTLSEKADFGDQAFAEAFGKSAREVLRFAWALDPEIPAFTRDGIRFVARSFATAPSDSRALLEKVLDEPRFSEHAHEEAPWLADGVPYIFKSDPQFAVRIYEVLFGRPAPQTGKTWFGGHRSRILPLISDRKQEYEHARWHLTRALKSFLAENPEYGVKAVINAAIGLSRHAAEPETLELSLDGLSVTVVDDYDSLEDWRVRDKRAGDTADDILGLFVDFLRSCSPSVFRAAIDTALRVKANTSVWSRLLGLAAERRAIADDLLWILATNPKFLSFRGVSREAISYLAAVYASRDAAERRDFEARSLNADLFEEERARNWWNALMARFLSVVSEDALMTDQMRALRRQLHEAGKLTGNRPFVSISSGWAPADNVVESLLKSSGVDLQRSADLEIRNVAQPLETFLKTVEKRGDDREIEQLWTMVQAVVGTIERVTEPHAESLHSSWGAVSNAIERIAQNKSYDPTKPGVPSLDALIALIERLMESPYPEVSERDDDGGLMGWGNWDIRVYAASSLVALAPRFATDRPEILEHLRTMLRDPVATVRLQIAQSVNVLWKVAREPMWEMVEFVANNETHRGVLGFFVHGPLRRLAGPDVERCERLAGVILNRLPVISGTEADKKRGTLEEAFGYLASGLWVWRGRQGARGWITNWCADLEVGEPYLWHVVSSLREPLFLTYNPKPIANAADIQARARDVLSEIVVRAGAVMESVKPVFSDPAAIDSKRASAQQKWHAGERMIDHAGNQLYFGSGAFRSNDKNEVGLPSPEAMRRFLSDYGEILDRIGRTGPVPIIHHLIELYGHLAAADPANVFDRLSRLLVGPAAEEGYHFESLASDVLVALIRRYLADHRSIFEDLARRQKLVEVLELFSNAGSPEALKLLYELPDLLR